MDSAPEVTGGGEVSAQEPPQPQAPSKFKIPVDGQEVEVDLDELKRGYSHARAANKRMQEAAAIRKAEEARKQRALKGDLDWLEELGAPEEQILKWAEQKLLKKIEFESMRDMAELSADRGRTPRSFSQKKSCSGLKSCIPNI